MIDISWLLDFADYHYMQGVYIWDEIFVMARWLAIASFCVVMLAFQTGCFTIALEATDIVSAKAAEEEGPAQEATENPVEHGGEEMGKATQTGVQKVKEAKRAAVEKVKEAVD